MLYMRNILQKIQTETGVERNHSETVSEYVERVSELCDVDRRVTSELVAQLHRTFYAPDSTEVDTDLVEEFLSDVSPPEGSDTSQDTSQGFSVEGRQHRNPAGMATSPGADEPGDDAAVATSSSRNASDAREDSAVDFTSTVSDTNTGVRGRLDRVISTTRKPRAASGRLSGAVNLRNSDYWMLTGLVGIGAYVFLQSLGGHEFHAFDEAIYANAARHMIGMGDWLVPHLYLSPQRAQPQQYQPFLEKPPLVFWLQAVSMKFFGISRFAVRLPVALLSIASGLVVYLIGTREYDRLSGVVAAVILFTTPMIYLNSHGGRTGTTDVPLMFFGTVFVYLSYVAFTENRRDVLPVVGVAAGLAVLTKSVQAGVFVFVVAPLAVYQYRTLLTREGALMVGATAGVVLPWSLYAWYRHPEQFVEEMILEQAVERAAGEFGVGSSDTLFSFMRYPYFQTFPTHFDPWVYFLFPALLLAVVHGWRSDGLGRPAFLTYWATSVFAFYLVTGNHGWYIMPMFVPCSLLIGKMGGAVARHDYVAIGGAIVGAATMVLTDGMTMGTLAVVGGIAALSVSTPIRSVAETTLSDFNHHMLKRVSVIIGAGLVVAVLVGTVPLGTGAPNYTPAEQLGKTAHDEVPTEETIVVGPETFLSFSFSFHAQRPLVQKTPAQIDRDSDLQYAYLGEETLAEIEREYTIIDRSAGSILVRLE